MNEEKSPKLNESSLLNLSQSPDANAKQLSSELSSKSKPGAKRVKELLQTDAMQQFSPDISAETE